MLVDDVPEADEDLDNDNDALLNGGDSYDGRNSDDLHTGCANDVDVDSDKVFDSHDDDLDANVDTAADYSGDAVDVDNISKKDWSTGDVGK